MNLHNGSKIKRELKQQRRINRHELGDYRSQMQLKTIEELEGIREKLNSEKNKECTVAQKHGQKIDLLASKIGIVVDTLDAKRHKNNQRGSNSVRLTDHAILRYIERCVGVDVEGHKKELEKKIEKSMIATRQQMKELPDEYSIVIDGEIELCIRRGNVTTTIINRKQ
jgi:hypothetical protein